MSAEKVPGPHTVPKSAESSTAGLKRLHIFKVEFYYNFSSFKKVEKKNVDVIDLEMPWPTNIYLVIKKLLVIHLSKKKKNPTTKNLLT